MSWRLFGLPGQALWMLLILGTDISEEDLQRTSKILNALKRAFVVLQKFPQIDGGADGDQSSGFEDMTDSGLMIIRKREGWASFGSLGVL